MSSSLLPDGFTERPASTGESAAAVSNAVVRIYARHHGRGPTKAKTYLFGDVILTLMEESAAPVLQTLAAAGEEELVRNVRTRVQSAMAEELKEAVQQITGRTVRALMSGSELEPDVRCDVFLLEPENAEPTG